MKETLLAASLIAGGNIVDYHTTNAGLNRPGYYEQNALIGRNGERLELVKGIAIVAETIIYREIRKKDKKAAWAFVGTIVAGNVILGIVNHNK